MNPYYTWMVTVMLRTEQGSSRNLLSFLELSLEPISWITFSTHSVLLKFSS